MAKGAYIGVDGKAKKVKVGYIGVDGKARKIKKAYIGVNGVAQLCWSAGVAINTLSVGASVFMKVDGTPREFIVVHKGNPSTTYYDSSCNGVWLLMKEPYETRKMNSSTGNNYANSSMHTYLNGEFLQKFDSKVQDVIKQVKIPYSYTGDSNATTGSSGLSTKVFLLSTYEVGFSWANLQTLYYMPKNEGAKLSYFPSGNSADSTRIAYMNGTATEWWLRSGYGASNVYIWTVDTTGRYSASCNATGFLRGVRPAMILPTDVLVDDSGNIIT